MEHDGTIIDFANYAYFGKGTNKNLLISDAIEMFILDNEARGNAEKTIESYRRYIHWFQEYQERHEKPYVHQIRGTDITAFLLEFRNANKKPSYIKLLRSVIRIFLNFLIDSDYLDSMPKFAQIKYRPERLYVPTVAQWKAIMDALDNPRDKLILMLMSDTGVRLAECAALTWEDIDFQNQILTITRGKGGKSRRVAMGSTLTKNLIAYHKHLIARGYNPQPDSIIFITHHGRPLERNGIASIWRRVSEKTGIRCSSHAWRRFFAKNAAVTQGMPLEVLRAAMGHASLETTAQYLGQLTDADLKSARQHSPVDGLKRLGKKRN